MPLKKISADEAHSKITARGLAIRSTPKGDIIGKASSAPASWSAQNRSARFVMTTQQVDRYGDVVVTNGGDTTAFETNPVGLLFHQSRDWPIGTWKDLTKVGGKNPRMLGDLHLLAADGPVPTIDQAAWMIEQGALRTVSIGFVPNWEMAEGIFTEDGAFTGIQWNGWELVECSLVPVPANPGALAKDYAGGPMARELLEDILENWQRTPEGLVVPRAEFEEAYQIVKKMAPDTKPQNADAPQAVDMKGIENTITTTIQKSLLGDFAARVREMFGVGGSKPPSEDEIAAAKAKSAAARARITEKGLAE